MPYIEYVDTRVPNVDAINCDSGLSLCNYLKQDTPFTTKEPNSVFYPKICLASISGEEIPCFDQSFDPNNLLLSLNVLYKEMYERRTFFFQLEKNLSNVAQKWASWGIGDTCLPLRGAYVQNWGEICANFNFKCLLSYGFFWPNNINCDANIFQREGPFYGPVILFLIPNERNNSQEVKWMMKLHSHEAGHWLYWLMKEKNFEFYTIDDNNCPTKCECLTYQKVGALAEAFAESHLFEFLYARITGYGNYEFADGVEVDTICEQPILKPNGIDNRPGCKRKCVNCGEDLGDYCSANYETKCNDQNNSPCSDLPIPTQTSLLRDIYDSVNSLKLDGGMDNVILPINQMFHCLKGKVNDVKAITPFLQAISNENICNVDLGSLPNYYSININPAPNP